MKLTFILLAFFFNFFNLFFIKAEVTINSSNNQIKNTSKAETNINNESEIKKIHIVKVGDTITNISNLYSIEKEVIIKLNDLKNENNIYVGQNLKIYDPNLITENISNQNIYHLVQKGENLTEISIKYGLDLKDLIEINNLKDKDSIEVGSKLFLNVENTSNQKISLITKDNRDKIFISEDKKIYGPIIVGQNELEKVSNRKILNALNQNNNKLIISIKCETKDIDVRIPGRKWRGWMPAKEEFEKNLINDFC